MSAIAANSIYRHGRERNFTKEEYSSLSNELFEAIQRGDDETGRRLNALLPVNPEVAKIFKDVYGKEYLLALGVDLTEANLRYGEGWLDERNKRQHG